jgi:hypothetical protein
MFGSGGPSLQAGVGAGRQVVCSLSPFQFLPLASGLVDPIKSESALARWSKALLCHAGASGLEIRRRT